MMMQPPSSSSSRRIPLLSSLSLLLAASPCLAHTHHDHSHHSVDEYCGTDDPTMDEMLESDRVIQEWLADHPCDHGILEHDGGIGISRSVEAHRNPHCHPPADDYYGTSSRQTVPPKIEIQVKWHTIARDDGTGAPSLQQVMDSVAALNAAFSHPTTGGFMFLFSIFADYTYTENTEWHFGHRMDLRSKQALRQGDCTTLNIYSTGSFQGGPFGWGTKPFKCEDGCYNNCLANPVDDGVVVRWDLLAGGPNPEYNEGDVLVHEVGHWLGLYHTFQNGCDAPGDYIFDTPAEAEAAWGCDEPRDTCTGKDDNPPGLDPIHNYMNLSNDLCMFEFTDGQFAFMYAQWDSYRQAAATTPPSVPQPLTPQPTPVLATPLTPIPTPLPTLDPTLPPTLPPTTPLPTSKATLSPIFVISTLRPTEHPTTAMPTDTVTPATENATSTPQPTMIATSPPTDNGTITLTSPPASPFPTNGATPQPSPQPTMIATSPPTPTDAAVPPASPSPTNGVTVLNQAKEAPPAKCGTIAQQSGYGGAAAQAKDCSNRRNRQLRSTMTTGAQKRRPLKGV